MSNSIKYSYCFLLIIFAFVLSNQAKPNTLKKLPQKFIGVWSIGSCEAYNKSGERDDGLMEISATALSFYESSCKIKKITKLKDDSLKLEVICDEYEMTQKDIFYIQYKSSQEIRMVYGRSLPFAEATTYVKCQAPSINE